MGNLMIERADANLKSSTVVVRHAVVLLDSGKNVAEHAQNEEPSHQVVAEAQTTC